MPELGDGNYQNQVVRITDLAVTKPILEDYRFHNCIIHGPGILLPMGDTTLDRCNWDSPTGVDGLFWEISPEREAVIGAIAVVNCHFVECDFRGVGLAGPPDLRKALEEGFGPPTEK